MLYSNKYNRMKYEDDSSKSCLHPSQYYHFQGPIKTISATDHWRQHKCQTLLFPWQPKRTGCGHQPREQVEATHLIDLSELSPKEQTWTVFTGSTSQQRDTHYTFKRIQGSHNIPESRQPKSEDLTQGNFPSDA